MMINHEGREFGDEIKDVFLKIPVPDKYNNHDLSVKVIYTSEKKLDKNHEEIDEFIRNNGIASRMVGRWFNRDYMTGICDVELVKERGCITLPNWTRLWHPRLNAETLCWKMPVRT